MKPEPYTIAVSDNALADLRARVAATRWPQPIPGHGWELGSEEATLRRLAARWIGGYDWRAHEREMNRWPHFVADLDGARVHFLHFRGHGPGPFPIVLTHGWPGSLLELRPLAEQLAARSFDVVVPSLPGFGFSAQRPQRTRSGGQRFACPRIDEKAGPSRRWSGCRTGREPARLAAGDMRERRSVSGSCCFAIGAALSGSGARIAARGPANAPGRCRTGPDVLVRPGGGESSAVSSACEAA
jgi:pimeloyl-ACP methyl ester carboxylesterase